MATTPLVLTSNRIGARSYLFASVAAVAVDASVSENFSLPTIFGDLWIEAVIAQVVSFSAAYVAVVPPDEGASFFLLSSDAASSQDFIGASRFVNMGSVSARPALMSYIELYRQTVWRQQELMRIQMPIMAGAGATATVSLFVRGIRVRL